MSKMRGASIQAKAAKVACFLAGVAAAISLLGWVVPSFLNVVADWVMFVGFLIAFLGIALVVLIVSANGIKTVRSQGWRVASQRKSVDFAWSRIPRRLKQTLVAIVTAAVVSGAFGLIGTAGYSQNPAWALSRCQWSIGTNHGLTNICVSHARWLSTGEGGQRGFIAFLAIFLAVLCGIAAAGAPRRPKMLGEPRG